MVEQQSKLTPIDQPKRKRGGCEPPCVNNDLSASKGASVPKHEGKLPGSLVGSQPRKRGCEGVAEAPRFNASEKRKRGDQPGNHNRLKHGFYSRQHPAINIPDINSYMYTNVKEQVALFRLTIRLALEMAHETRSFAEKMAYFRAITFAFSQMAHLVGVEHSLVANPSKPEGSSINDLSEQAIEEVIKEMQAKDFTPNSNRL